MRTIAADGVLACTVQRIWHALQPRLETFKFRADPHTEEDPRRGGTVHLFHHYPACANVYNSSV